MNKINLVLLNQISEILVKKIESKLKKLEQANKRITKLNK